MKKLIVVISGKKRSGKNTLANEVMALALNTLRHEPGVSYSADGDHLVKHTIMIGGPMARERLSVETGVGDEGMIADLGVRIIAFATPLKAFCRDVLGLSHEQCYGTDEEKNSLTKVRWDGLPLRVRMKNRKAWWHVRPRSGYMTGREVMQVFGTDVIRRWHPDAWAYAGYTLAKKCPEQVVAICDGRFPNEIELGAEFQDSLLGVHVRTVRLGRNANPDDTHPSETALDGFAPKRFDAYVLGHLNIRQMFELMRPKIRKWLREAGLEG